MYYCFISYRIFIPTLPSILFKIIESTVYSKIIQKIFDYKSS